jgi:beta-xylosidase
MIVRSVLAAALALSFAAPALAADAPGSNPIIRDKFTADPAALVVGDTVYLYAGHDVSSRDTYVMPEWLLYSSKDMKTWTSHGVILKPTDFSWSTGDAYASQVVEKGGKYYFFATARDRGVEGGRRSAMAIGVAVSDKPTGPFVDAIGKPLITNDMTPDKMHGWNDIDPTVFTDDDGTSWLMWGNEHCYLVKLKPNMIELDGPIRQVELPKYTEGPWLHKRGGFYYLTYASWDAPAEKAERIFYATATSIEGPWTPRGELTGFAENSSTIHPAIIDFKGKSYFFYHDGGWTIDGVKGGSYRRSVRVEPLHYNADGTIQPIKQTAEGVSAER